MFFVERYTFVLPIYQVLLYKIMHSHTASLQLILFSLFVMPFPVYHIYKAYDVQFLKAVSER